MSSESATTRSTPLSEAPDEAVAALYTLVRRPDLFGMGLLESTSLHTGNGQLLRDVTPLVIGPRKVYIGVGTDEVVGHEQLAQERALEVDTVDRVLFIGLKC